MITRAVIVGASTYRQREVFSPLRGAALDAVWFERFLRSKGVSGPNVTCLTGDAATKQAIIGAIRTAPSNADEENALMVFFSGHGGTLRLADGRNECVLFCHDTSIRDRIGTSVGITELLEAVSGALQTEEIYLFLDACHITLGALAHQLNVLADRARGARVFCCIIANDGGVSVEGFVSPMGEFSSVLLASLQHVDASEAPSAGALALEVARRAAPTGVTLPRSVVIGDPRRWPFRPRLQIREPLPRKSEVFRSKLVSAALNLLKIRDGARVCIVGPSGSGKSVVLKQTAQILGRCPVASFTREDTGISISVASQRVVQAIVETMMPSADADVIAHTLETAIRAFAASNPHPVIGIDGGENLAHEPWSAILRALDLHGVDLITTRHEEALPDAELREIAIEPMSLDEIGELSVIAGVPAARESVARAYAISGGYPLPFLAALGDSKPFATPAALQRTVQILRTSGGFCSQPLFCALTNIDRVDLERLRDLGLLIHAQDVIRLHDFVPDEIDLEDDGAIANAVASYWQAEQAGSNALSASLKIIELCLNPSLFFQRGSVAAAMRTAEGRVTSPALASAAVNAAKRGDESALIYAVEVLSRRGDGDLLASLLEITDGNPAMQAHRADPRLTLARARAAWWAGDYPACRRHAEAVLGRGSDHRRAALLELAIADFFEGRWSAAQQVLEELSVAGSGELREVGWAQLILGTCLGIRGAGGERGRALLRSAAELLRATNDLAGFAIAKGNCGEVSWKTGDFEAAERELHDGLSTAEMLGMSINAVESRRNLIQLYLRWFGPNDDRIRALEQQLERLSTSEIGRMEMMQVANTMATLNLYRGNLATAENWMKTARPLTADNDEYDIYTQANDAILMTLRGGASGREKISAAVQLCAEGGNRLALTQVRRDVIFCLGRLNTDIASEFVEIIDQQAKGMTS